MLRTHKVRIAAVLATCGLFGWACNSAAADVRIGGQVRAGVAHSQTPPLRYGQRVRANPGNWLKRNRQRRPFRASHRETLGTDVSLYLVAKGGQATNGDGDNPAIALLTVLGNTPPANVVINEMTTVASVWTNAQFLDGAAIKGPALGLRIAAGNVPNFVDL